MLSLLHCVPLSGNKHFEGPAEHQASLFIIHGMEGILFLK